MKTKKILLYTGGALALGAVTYFVWSFFQKIEIPIGNTTVTLGDNTEEDSVVSQSTTPFNNPFTPLLNTTFEPIKTPNIFADVRSFPLNSISAKS
jgi:hypothetical protein